MLFNLRLCLLRKSIEKILVMKMDGVEGDEGLMRDDINSLYRLLKRGIDLLSKFVGRLGDTADDIVIEGVLEIEDIFF